MFTKLHAALLSFLAFLGFAHPGATLYQGYGEGEYVLVAPQIAGTLETLNVSRGQSVHKGDLLYTLEHASEDAALHQAEAEVLHAEAALTDLVKAKRQPELDQLVASRDQAKAALQIAQINFDRDLKQVKVQAISQAALDADKATLDQAHAHLTETEAALETGRLPIGRDDVIHAAQADLIANRHALAAAQWKVDQKKVLALEDAFVFDTLYRAGEYINAGQPVVSLLPPSHIRVRFFVPATQLPSLSIDMKVSLDETGSKQSIPAHITYISPQAEYSPPELYNRDNREKLLFMIEATPDVTPEKVHPGLPLDVVVDSSMAREEEPE